MRLLFLGDVVGRPGRRALAATVPRLRKRLEVEFVVANCENAAGGKGVDPKSAEELRDAGVDVLTSGNHIWQKREILPYLRENERLLRPLNFAPDVPGVGWTIRETSSSRMRVGVVNLIGRVFMGPAECPFRAAEAALPRIAESARVILVDMHAEATSEKVSMGWFLDGRVSAVIGSHTHVQTADEGILPGGTAYLTDAGMCGPEASVLGVRTDAVVRRFLTQMPARFDVASGPVVVQGAVIDVDEGSGRARSIERICERIGEV
jgi:metallophosphoesterase (TIGR00282 family)